MAVKKKEASMAVKKKFYPSLFSSYFHFITHFVPNWEEIIDPNNPSHQMSLLLGIQEMAEMISDRTVRTQVQSITKKSIADVIQKM
jgi:hypothetical protein